MGTSLQVKYFTRLALAFGTVYALLVPPFQSPDEYNHFFRAWQVSEGQYLPEKTADGRLGGRLPASLDSLCRAFLFLKNDYAAKTDFGQIAARFRMPLQPEKTAFLDFPNTAIYAPTAYLPQAAAIAALRVFEAPPLLALYAGRLANLFLWIFLLQAALRRMPFQMMAIAFVALLPASLVVAASLNADVPTNGLCFWLTANCCARFAEQNTRIPLAEWLAVMVVSVNKLVFAPLALFCFLPMLGQKTSRRTIFFSLLLLATSIGAAVAWGRVSQAFFIPFEEYHPAFRAGETLNEGVDPMAQLHFVLENPLRFVGIAATSYLESLPATAAHLVGKFGWEKNYLPGWCMALLWLALVAVVFAENNPLGRQHRLLLAVIAAVCIAAFSVTMYALWCPVGSAVLTNLQGRYFVPLLPAAVLIIGLGWLLRFRAEIGLAVFGICLLAQAMMSFCIWQRYFL